MSKYLAVAVTLLFLSCASDVSGVNTSHYSNGESVVGPISATNLLAKHPDFSEAYDNYQASSDDIKLMSNLEGMSLLVVFGTWCHDSAREIPRLLKLIDKSQVNLASLKLVALDRNKQDPAKIYRLHDVRFTPTIILFDGERELGRVVESPVVSLSQDLADFTINRK